MRILNVCLKKMEKLFLKCTCGISIALAIHSVDPALGLRYGGFRRFYTPSWISIAVAIRSFDPTPGLAKAIEGILY